MWVGHFMVVLWVDGRDRVVSAMERHQKSSRLAKSSKGMLDQDSAALADARYWDVAGFAGMVWVCAKGRREVKGREEGIGRWTRGLQAIWVSKSQTHVWQMFSSTHCSVTFESRFSVSVSIIDPT